MTDKTDLIELTDSEEQMVSIIWQAFPEYFDGAVEGQNYGDSEKLTRLARELSEHFIEQACEAVEVRKNKLLEINESMPAKEQAMLVAGLCEAQQAIRDRFNSSESS